MGHKYVNPPVVEAVCEFRFAPSTPWDTSIAARLYERMKHVFPREERRDIHELEVVQTEVGIEPKVRQTERFMFLSADGNEFIQVGPQLLATNRLKPYVSWEAYQPTIALAFEALMSVVPVDSIERIGLRYINRIEIASANVTLDDYFEFRPYTGERLPKAMAAFRLAGLFAFDDRRAGCKIELVNAIAETPEATAFLLDIDYFTTEVESVRAHHALEWVWIAHQRVEDVFEGCITDRLREMFSEAQP